MVHSLQLIVKIIKLHLNLFQELIDHGPSLWQITQVRRRLNPLKPRVLLISEFLDQARMTIRRYISCQVSSNRLKTRWRRTDDRWRIKNHLENWRQKDEGLLIMVPSMRPISWHLSNKVAWIPLLMYLQCKAVSNQCCVSACSESESLSLLTKWDSCRLFCQASAKFAPMARDDRLIWSVKENISSFGKVFVTFKISCCNSNAAW